jgi:osmotically-inducible protein OsmY
MVHRPGTGYGPGFERYYYGYYGPYFARTARHDVEIKADVRNRLVWDSWVNADDIDIDVKNGVVTLTGEVDSIVEKRAAGDDAWDTPGVLDVANQLRIRQPEPQR